MALKFTTYNNNWGNIAGFSVAVDSLSAIKYAKIKLIRDENGVVVDYEIRKAASLNMVTTMIVLTKSLFGYWRFMTRLKT